MKGLGRGLNSLFGNFNDDLEDSNENQTKDIKNNNEEQNLSGVLEIDVGLIDRNVNQPRKHFDEKALNELSQSIKQHGIIQPLILQKTGDRYQIIAGERRFRAARLAGLKTVPAVIKDYSKQEVSEISIIENLQREDLNQIESAKAIQSLIDEFNLTQEEVADKLGKSRPAVANTLRLLTLPAEVIKYIEEGKISAGHARTLLGLSSEKDMIEFAKLIIAKKLSVRDLEVLVKNSNNKPAKSKQVVEQSLELKDFSNNLNRLFSTKVSIQGNDKKGKIIIDYYNKNDLQRIYDILNR